MYLETINPFENSQLIKSLLTDSIFNSMFDELTKVKILQRNERFEESLCKSRRSTKASM